MKTLLRKMEKGIVRVLFRVGIIRRPQVHLESIEVQSLSLEEVSLLLVISIENPNLFQIRISSLDYRVFLGEYTLAEGSSYHPGADFDIRRLNGSIIEIPISFPFSKTGFGIRTAFLPGKIPYRIEATAFLKFPLGIIPVRLHRSGEHQVILPEVQREPAPSEASDPEIQPSPSIH